MLLYLLLPAAIGLVLLCGRGKFALADNTPNVESVTWPILVVLLPTIPAIIVVLIGDLISPRSQLWRRVLNLGFALGPLLLVLIYLRPRLSELGVRWLRPWPFTLSIACLLMLVPGVYSIATLALKLSSSIGIPFEPWWSSKNLLEIESSRIIVRIILLLGVAPLREELIYRGIVFTALRSRWGPWPAALACNFLFALAHQPFLMLQAFLVGMFLTLLYEKTGSIVPSILGHLSINFPLAFGLLIVLLERPTPS